MEGEAASASFRLRTYLREKSGETRVTTQSWQSPPHEENSTVKTGSRQSRHRFIYLHIKFLITRHNLSRKPVAVQKDTE